MNAQTWNDRWRNAFIYALVTTVMVLSAATVASAVFGKAQQALANRVDHNSAVVVCILQLGVDSDAPQRSTKNVDRCLADPSWVNPPAP